MPPPEPYILEKWIQARSPAEFKHINKRRNTRISPVTASKVGTARVELDVCHVHLALRVGAQMAAFKGCESARTIMSKQRGDIWSDISRDLLA